MINFLIIVFWAFCAIGITYLAARVIMKAWLTEIDLYINKVSKLYLSKIEKENEESKE